MTEPPNPEWSDPAVTAAMLSAIVASSDQAILAKDLDARVTVWNPASERLYGYTAEEMIGQPIAIIVPPDKAGEDFDILNTVLRGERVDHRETHRITKSGKIVEIAVSASPVYDSTGAIIGASVTSRDIGESKRLEQLQNDLDRSEFVAHVAHELRTPLTIIAGLTEMLSGRARELPQEEIDRTLSALDRQGRRALVLINDLLDLSRLSRGTFVVELTEVNLSHAVVAALDSSIPAETATSEVSIPPGTTVLADQRRLEQVFVNLFTNSFRHGGEKISVSAQPNGSDRVQIKVLDDGPGVDEAMVDQLFEPFVAGKSSTSSGLGLAITRRLVEAFGGTIEYEQSDSGACFRLMLACTPGSDKGSST
ncbi:MAG: nitrogen regulation protein NR(II) [Actinomycetota bacterium]